MLVRPPWVAVIRTRPFRRPLRRSAARADRVSVKRTVAVLPGAIVDRADPMRGLPGALRVAVAVTVQRGRRSGT